MRTLATIGYHNGEVKWGRLVRKEYEKRGLKGHRDLSFYEVLDSDVETGEHSKQVMAEIERKIEEAGAGLWIDIHCCFNDKHQERASYLSCTELDREVIDRLRQLDDVHVQNANRIPPKCRPEYPYALVDPFFSREELENRGPIYQKALERTLRFINEVHDAHN